MKVFFWDIWTSISEGRVEVVSDRGTGERARTILSKGEGTSDGGGGTVVREERGRREASGWTVMRGIERHGACVVVVVQERASRKSGRR